MANTRNALIIANNEYVDDGLSRLRAPAHDAESLGEVLRSPDIGAFDVRTLLNAPAHEATLAVEEFFADRRPDDLLLMHVSCHGVKDEGGDLYFAASNTRVTRLGATAIPANFVNRCMGRSRSRRIVLLLDCCYAGAFERGMLARGGSSGVAIEEQLGGRGRAVITASSAMEYAFEGGDLRDENDSSPSVFTSALVEGLRTGDADRDQDGSVALDELYEYVYEKVRAETPNQTPGKWVFGVQGDLVIARRARPVTSPAPLETELQEAVDSAFASVRLAVLPELGRLARGRHEGRALAARMTLERLAHDDSRMVSEAAAATLAEQAESHPETTASVIRASPGVDGSADTSAGAPTGAVTEPVDGLGVATATPKATAASPPVAAVPTDVAGPPKDSPISAASPGQPSVTWRLPVAGALTALGGVLLLAGLFPPYVVDSNGTSYTIPDTGGTWYAVILLVGLCIAAALLLVTATRALIGAGFLVGLSTGTVSAPVFAVLLPHTISVKDQGSSVGSAYYLTWLSAIAVLAGTFLCAWCLPRWGVRLLWPGRAGGWATWAVAVLGVVSAIALVVHVWQATELPEWERKFDASIDLPTAAIDGLMLAIIAIVAAASTPRRFGVAVLSGWLVAAASMVAYYMHGRLTVFTISIVAMAAVGVVFAREAKARTPLGESPAV
jgi:MFS family permease